MFPIEKDQDHWFFRMGKKQNGGNGTFPAFPLNHDRADIFNKFPNIFSKN